MKFSAFSLLELSIVLVIIGLIAGGITVGADMVRAAEIRGAMTEFGRYQTAVYTFKDKYMALPGDMKNAQSFWGAEPVANCPGTNTTPSSGAATCNGNGDGMLAGAATSQEHFRFWQHLANAGLIEGIFTGVTDNGGSTIYATQGKNVPASKYPASSWYAMYGWGTALVTDVNLFEGFYGSFLMFGGAGSNYSELPTIRASDAWTIDTKLDDGKPGTGIIRSFERDTNCQDAGVQATAIAGTANYNVSTTTQNACALMFNLE